MQPHDWKETYYEKGMPSPHHTALYTRKAVHESHVLLLQRLHLSEQVLSAV